MSELIPSSPSQGCFGSTRPIGAGAVVKKSGALFGPRDEDVQKLKESSKKEKSAEPFHYIDKRMAPVPDREEKPVLGIRTNKNFITANAVQAILQGGPSYDVFIYNDAMFLFFFICQSPVSLRKARKISLRKRTTARFRSTCARSRRRFAARRK